MSFTEQSDHKQVDHFFFTHDHTAGILADSASCLLNLADFIYLCHLTSLRVECREQALSPAPQAQKIELVQIIRTKFDKFLCSPVLGTAPLTGERAQRDFP